MDNNKVDPKIKLRSTSNLGSNSYFPLIKKLKKKAQNLILEIHNSNKDTFYRKTANDIVYNEKSHIVAMFKDYLIFDDTSEFLKRFYNINEIKFRLPKYLEYYELNSKIFPNYINLMESKYLYRNIKRKQRMIDNIQKHENDKKRKRENEETMIFNTRIIDYIINQTSICDSQTNINLNNSLKNSDKKPFASKPANNKINKITNINDNHKPEKPKDKTANKNKNVINNLNQNNNKNNNNNNNANLNKEKNNNFYNLNSEKNCNFACSEKLQEINKEDNANINNNNNINGSNLNIFSKFDKQMKSNGNLNENPHLKVNNNKKEQKSFNSVEFLIEAIDQAEKIVKINPQSHRDLYQSHNNLDTKSIEKSNFNNKENIKFDLNFKNKLDNNFSKKYLSKKKQINKDKNKNLIENASTFNTAEAINSNLSAKDKKYLTRNEIILNNLLSKNSLNKDLKSASSINNINNYNLNKDKDKEKVEEEEDKDYNYNSINKEEHKINNKNILERENSIALQRKKLEKELNLDKINESKNPNIDKVSREKEDAGLVLSKNQKNLPIKNSQNYVDYIDLDEDKNNENNIFEKFEFKKNQYPENLKFPQHLQSRNLLNFNCISSINNPSTDKNGLLSDNTKTKNNSLKTNVLQLNNEANKIMQSNSLLNLATEKSKPYSSSKKISSKLREKEGQLIKDKLNNHFNFNYKKAEINLNGNYNTNILSSRENLKVLFNKTNIDFANFNNKITLNSHRLSQNFSTVNAKKNNLVFEGQSPKNSNNNNKNKNDFNDNNNNNLNEYYVNLNDNHNQINFCNENKDNSIKNEDKSNSINKNNLNVSENKQNYKIFNNDNKMNALESQEDFNGSVLQKKIKVILQDRNLLSKDEIKISSYRSKENNNNNLKRNFNSNKFNKSNNNNNNNFTNTAREFSRQAKSGFSFLNSENLSVINNNNNNNNKKQINTRKSIFSPINNSTKFIANLSPKQSTPEKIQKTDFNLEEKQDKNASVLNKLKESNKTNCLINYNANNFLINNSNKILYSNDNIKNEANKNTNKNLINNSNLNNKEDNSKINSNQNNNFVISENSNSKIFSNQKSQLKITNATANEGFLGSHRDEKNGNFLYNIIGNAVKAHEAEFKILSARLNRKGLVPSCSISRLDNPNLKSVQNFANKNSLKDKNSKLNSNNTKSLKNNNDLNSNTGLNSNLNLQNSNSNFHLNFNASNASIKLNFTNKNKSVSKKYLNAKTKGNNLASLNNEKLIVKDNNNNNVVNLDYEKNTINAQVGEISGNKNISNKLGSTTKIKGIQIKNFNHILHSNFSTAKISSSERTVKSNKKN